jgi:glucose dehydrogenase
MRKITWGAPQPGDWLTYNGNDSGNRYSPLRQIDTSNVASLKLKWVFPLSYFGLETTPLEADGVLYVTGPNQVYALDALSGNPLWQYSRPASAGLTGDARLGTNRGVAILRDKVFFVTDNAHLLALDRATGKLVWEKPMADERQHYGGTVAPLIVHDTVVVGVAGADQGIRGFVAAFQADTGALAWRRWTVPRRGEPGIETWQGKEPTDGRRLHLAHGFFRCVVRHALLGHRQSLAGRRRPRPAGRQHVHQLRSGAGCEDRGPQVALSVHAARREGSRCDRA